MHGAIVTDIDCPATSLHTSHSVEDVAAQPLNSIAPATRVPIEVKALKFIGASVLCFKWTGMRGRRLPTLRRKGYFVICSQNLMGERLAAPGSLELGTAPWEL